MTARSTGGLAAALPRFAVHNPVAMGLMTALIVGLGLYYWFTLTREFFPNLEAERITVSVLLPGATPEEAEKLVARPLEQSLRAVRNVRELRSQVIEGLVVSYVELYAGSDTRTALDEVRSAVDRVRSELPDDAEEPRVEELKPKVPVVICALHGDVRERLLRDVAREIKDELLERREISEIDIVGVRPRELWVELRPEALEAYGLTFAEVGERLAAANLDLPGGQLEGERGNIRVRALAEGRTAEWLERLILRGSQSGRALRLGEVATVREAFADRVLEGRFDGERACQLVVWKSAGEDALAIAKVVRAYVAEHPELRGGALELDITLDLARFIEERLELMTRNAKSGLIFVMIALALVLELRVAIWVAAGIPIAFLGTFGVMAWVGVSINMISLFGLIVVLGIIVDDAIVIGENIFTRTRAGQDPHSAAIEGAGEVALPVLAAVLTTIVAFLPLMFIAGQLGTMLEQLPLVVIAALSVSLIEAFLILPHHLSHGKPAAEPDSEPPPPAPGWRGWPTRAWRVSWAWLCWLGELKYVLVERWGQAVLDAMLRVVLPWRYAFLGLGAAILVLSGGILASGKLPFVLVQEMDAETIAVNLEMEPGTQAAGTRQMMDRIEQLARGCVEVRTVSGTLGSGYNDEGPINPDDPATMAQLQVELHPAASREAERQRNAVQLAAHFREALRDAPGVSRLTFEPQTEGPKGADISLRLKADALPNLQRAVIELRERMSAMEAISQVSDDLRLGKRELRVEAGELAQATGLSSRELALQLRHALAGFEAQELQEEDGELTVRVRLAASDRRGPDDLLRLRIRTPSGDRPHFETVAQVEPSRGFATLTRVDGRRAVTVDAEVDELRYNVNAVTAQLVRQLEESGFAERHRVSFSFEGRKKQTTESLGSLKVGFPVALALIYCMIAILFGSYTQPLIVMAAIPFAFIGAVAGHLLTGFPFTFMSMIGCVALSGIVVNDSLILVDFINRERAAGRPPSEAAREGSLSRLRAIVLTSVTTIAGLTPLLAERSFQAQFLIPMAVSIVYGLAFGTIVILVLIPAIFLLLDDAHRSWRWLRSGELPGD